MAKFTLEQKLSAVNDYLQGKSFLYKYWGSFRNR
ncbi:hypothetical protein JOD43_004037 [Pullulanibacillus pueri]|nr:hypothetical protein [Pullulanibacillus pueri]